MNNKTIFIIFLLSLIFQNCQKSINFLPIPTDDGFYLVTRFIMTKEEREIYKHLPDNQSREEFAIDFWLKRDPNPTTEENENKEEFEKRVNYANKHFRDKRIKDRGWDTDRGRILIHLGFPDQVSPVVTTLRGTTKQVQAEIWYYYRYQLKLVFIARDGFGQYLLEKWPTRLQSFIEKSKNFFDAADFTSYEKLFKFSLDYKSDNIIIAIPIKKIQFSHQGDKFKAQFEIVINIYNNYKKVDTLHYNKDILRSETELIKIKNLQIQIPLNLKEKGLYHLETIVKEIITTNRYRIFHKIKI